MKHKLPLLDQFPEIDDDFDDFDDDHVFDETDYEPDTEGSFGRYDDYPDDSELDFETPLIRRKL